MNFKEKLFGFGKKSWDYIKLARIELLIIVGILVLDMLTKSIVAGLMQEGQDIALIPNFLYITFVTNDKAAFSWDFGLSKLIGIEGTRIVFLIITILAVIVFCYVLYRFRGKHILSRVGFALIISGALGNFIDRLFLKYVRDFIEIRYFGLKIFGSYSFPIFNVADMALTVGVVLFLVFYLFLYREPKDKNDKASPAVEGAEQMPVDGTGENFVDAENKTVVSAADEREIKAAPPVVPQMVDAFDDGPEESGETPDTPDKDKGKTE